MNRSEKYGFKSLNPTKTQQHFEAECNINNIMSKYRNTGVLADPTKVPTNMATFGDFSGTRDFLSIQMQIIKANDAFMQLPAKIRDRFKNEPGRLIAFCQDKKNYQEAINLGLIPKPQKKAAPQPIPTTPAPTSPPAQPKGKWQFIPDPAQSA